MNPSAEANHSYPRSLEHDHKKCVSEALGIAEQLCVVLGVQLTPIRHQVLELIWDSHKAVKAYDLQPLVTC
jgi:Fur family zinc uptake transcriptional regulator